MTVFEPKASFICSYRTLGHLSILLIDAVNSFFCLKNASITHLKFVETRPRDIKIHLTKVKFVDYCMKWIVLPYLESYFEDTKYILVSFDQFSCIQEYYYTNSIWKCVWPSILFQPFLHASAPAEYLSNTPTFFVFIL